jgi:hypothetical protein
MKKIKYLIRSYFRVLFLVMLVHFMLACLISNSSYKFNAAFNEYYITRKKDYVKNFNITHNTLVLLHIQKTSGSSFDLDFVNTLEMSYKDETGRQVTRKACTPTANLKDVNVWWSGPDVVECFRSPNINRISILLSWHTDFGWSCGLHPGLSDLKECVFNRRYPNADPESRPEDFLFLSMLREPIVRFVSEWRHVYTTRSVWLYEEQVWTNDLECLKSKFFYQID